MALAETFMGEISSHVPCPFQSTWSADKIDASTICSCTIASAHCHIDIWYEYMHIHDILNF